MALVSELVTLHKGKLDYQSKKGGFTEFIVSLPVSKPSFTENEIAQQRIGRSSDLFNVDVTPKSAWSSSDSEVKADSPILLIVEDNSDVRNLLKNLFEDDYSVIEAENGDIGIEKAFINIPDIIISDVMMPEKDGVELAKTLKTDERTSHIPLILLTAKAGEENEIKGLETGVDDYITKPFSNDLLKLRVKKLIELRAALLERYSQDVVLRPKDIAISSIDEKFLERIQIVLDAQLTEPSFTAEIFSKEMGMSRMQLHRKLKAIIGLSTTEFIRSQRLKLAAVLLQNNGTNVSEVCYTVGFSDPSYFTKCFKVAYDRTPTQFKEAHS